MNNTRPIVITGANSGLGFETARLLLQHDVPLVLACRNADKGQKAKTALTETGARASAIEIAQLDVSDFDSVRRFAKTCKQKQIQSLICNAGIQVVTGVRRNADGVEETFATNHLGHFLLARQLLPSLATGGRIVFVSSNTHDPCKLTGMPAPKADDLESLAQGTAFAHDSIAVAGRRRYTTSKLCNVLCAYEFARRVEHTPIASKQLQVCAFDPGLMPGTGLAREYGTTMKWMWHNVMPTMTALIPNINTVSVSAQRLADVAIGKIAIKNGSYVSNGRVCRSSKRSYDTDLSARLWTLSSNLVELSPDVSLSDAA